MTDTTQQATRSVNSLYSDIPFRIGVTGHRQLTDEKALPEWHHKSWICKSGKYHYE